ncbi:MAG: D-2-hydroxyacid dehydrogenase, partial [Chloroflexota bacterium]
MQVMVPDYLVDYLTPRMKPFDPALELLPISAEGRYAGSLERLEVFFKFYPDSRFHVIFGADVLRAILRGAPRLRWVHSGKAGVEDLLIPELVESELLLTNGAGAPRLAIAETVLAFILADAKSLPDHFRSQQAKRWEHRSHRELPGLTVAVLGLGRIGLEIARLCRALDMRVIGTKRTLSAEPLPGVEEVFPPERQGECVAQADYVVVAAAMTPKTRGMVNASTLGAMRSDGVLINISRGGLVDEPALIEALRSQRIRAAYLDVFATEPLPPESPLFDLPNLVITPH